MVLRAIRSMRGKPAGIDRWQCPPVVVAGSHIVNANMGTAEEIPDELISRVGNLDDAIEDVVFVRSGVTVVVDCLTLVIIVKVRALN